MAVTPAPTIPQLSPAGIPLRPFGKTGHKLPVLGMGGSAFVQVFIAAYGVPLLSMEERVAMVRLGYDRGIRYFDTARVYGESERIVGQALKGVRDDCYVATKCHISDPAKTRETVEKSLKELDMDRVDCVQVHSPCIEAVGFEGAMKVHAQLVKLRDESAAVHRAHDPRRLRNRAQDDQHRRFRPGAVGLRLHAARAWTRCFRTGTSNFAICAWQPPTNVAWRSWP